jgi:tRNA G10  N-methylase Trm11
MYRWFVPQEGTVLDPFAGGSVRGVVAAHLGYKYTGIELRKEQVKANEKQAKDITPNNLPKY